MILTVTASTRSPNFISVLGVVSNVSACHGLTTQPSLTFVCYYWAGGPLTGEGRFCNWAKGTSMIMIRGLLTFLALAFFIAIRLLLVFILWHYTCVLCPAGMSCGDPPAISNGNLNFNGTSYNDTVYYTCDKGYTLNTDPVKRCTAKRRWSGLTPRCSKYY